MPTIKRLGSIKINIYLRDHNPPHFHALYAGEEELIIISNLETYIGKIPPRQKRIVLEWASQNQEYLITKWNEYNPQ